jgi:peptide deformylase
MSKEIHICHIPEEVLRKQCALVAPDQIQSNEIQQIITNMSQALCESGDGVAIAAPQIGHSVCIFVVAGNIMDHANNYHGEHVSPDKVFINPKIIKASKTKKSMRGEGCLSVRFIYGTTKRYDKVTVKAYDEHGKEFITEGQGLLAQIFQHEIDHLNGVLFIDHAHDIREMTDEEKANYKIELEKMKAERMNT